MQMIFILALLFIAWDIVDAVMQTLYDLVAIFKDRVVSASGQNN